MPPDDGQIIALSDNTSGWQLKTTPDTGVRTFGVAVSGTPGARTQRYSKTVVSLNKWYHVAGVYNATAKTLDIYVNGVLDDGVLVGTVPASQVLPAINASIGNRSGGYYFNGVIDNVRVYTQALSAIEVQADMNTPIASNGSGTLPAMSSLQCSPAMVVSGGTSTCTVSLSGPAPSGGLTVALSHNSAALTVPSSVTVAAGSSSAVFNAAAASVTADQSATITASLNGKSVTSTVNISAPLPVLSALQCSPSTIASGDNSQCTVSLSGPAPSGGLTVALSHNSAALTVPSSVTVAAGSSSAVFNAAAASVTADQSATITASLNGKSVTSTVNISAPLPVLSALQCSPSTIASGDNSQCMVSLSGLAPSGGLSIALSGNSPLTVPSSVTVAAGSSSAVFNAAAASVTADQSATITASLNGKSVTSTVNISAPLPVLSALQCSPSTIASGDNSQCTVSLSGLAPSGGLSIALSGNSPLTVPSSVTVAAGSSSAVFNAAAASVTADQSATITASLNGKSVIRSLAIQCPPTTPIAAYAFDEGSGSAIADASGHSNSGQLQSTSWSATAKYGKAVSFNGTSSYIDLGNPSSLQTTGSMSWSAWIYATGNPADDGQIVAQSNNAGWQFKTSADTGQRTFGVMVSGSSSSITQRYSKTVVALNQWYYVAGVYNAAAETLDIYVNGALDNGALSGTVPSSQYVPDVNATIGKRGGGFYFNGIIDNLRIYNRAVTAAEIQSDMYTAISSDVPGETLPTLSSMQCSPATVLAGGNSTCTVILSRPAPAGGSSITLSDDSAALTVPASVTVAAGASSRTFTVTTGAVTAEESARITAWLNGSSAAASLSIQPPPTNLHAEYGFDEGSGATVADSSGNSNTGQIRGASWSTTAKYGPAVLFDGTSSYIDLGNPSSLQTTGSMSWSAWIYATGNPPDDGQIVARSNNAGWQFKTTPDTGKRTFGVMVSGSSTSITQRYSKTVVALNTWYHVAGVYNAAAKTLDIYVNGVLDNGALSGTVPSSQYVPNLNVTIGKRSDGFYFKGIIDNLRIYDRALTVSEIQNDMYTPVAAKTARGAALINTPDHEASITHAPVGFGLNDFSRCASSMNSTAPTLATSSICRFDDHLLSSNSGLSEMDARPLKRGQRTTQHPATATSLGEVFIDRPHASVL